jgi:hypothetical protein
MEAQIRRNHYFYIILSGLGYTRDKTTCGSGSQNDLNHGHAYKDDILLALLADPSSMAECEGWTGGEVASIITPSCISFSN